MALVSKTGFIKLLGRSPSFLLGGAFLGSTASIPRIKDTFNSGCFDLNEELKGKANTEEEQASVPNSEPNSSVNTEENSISEKFTKGIWIELQGEMSKDFCYNLDVQKFWEWVENRQGDE